jgi:hypothetical protein
MTLPNATPLRHPARRWAVQAARAACAAMPLSAAPSTACTHRAMVADVYMSLDSDGTRHRTEFFTDTQSIYCIADVVAAPKGTTVEGQLRQVQGAGPTPALLGLGEDVVSGARTVDSFQLTRPLNMANAPWPVGHFECDILIDGVQAAVASFEITMPQCPLYPAQDGLSCAGFYPVGTNCMAVVQTQTCVCDASGIWKC